jgi:hypothetical protein
MIYVTNTGSGTVSIVDGKVDGTFEIINFNINPPNSRSIAMGNQLSRAHLLFTGTVRIAFGSSNPLDL